MPTPKYRPRKVADLMTKNIIAVGPKDEIGNILSTMEEFRFRHLPVVDGDTLVGLVTQRDLLHASSSFLSEKAEARDQLIGHAHIEDIMQEEVLTATPDDTLSEIGRVMLEAKIGCVCVVEGGRLVGILTDSDFIRGALWFLAKE